MKNKPSLEEFKQSLINWLEGEKDKKHTKSKFPDEYLAGWWDGFELALDKFINHIKEQ